MWVIAIASVHWNATNEYRNVTDAHRNVTTTTPPTPKAHTHTHTHTHAHTHTHMHILAVNIPHIDHRSTTLVLSNGEAIPIIIISACQNGH